MHEELKAKMGIDNANCSTCAYLGSDDDGNYPEMMISWSICEKFHGYEDLKSFPFKKDMPCWHPEFWHSKFADIIDGSDGSIKTAFDEFRKALDGVER